MSDTQTATRTHEGLELPLAGTYAIDPAHTHVGFTVRHLGVSKVRGRFADVEGTLTVADDPTGSALDVRIDVGSVDTRDDQRDGHLRSADFLDVENHPEMRYRSTAVSAPDAEGNFTVDGELTVRGTTRPVRLEATYEGALVDPWGLARFGFTATAEIDREDFGLTWNQVLESGGVLVGKKVKIEIEGEATHQG